MRDRGLQSQPHQETERSQTGNIDLQRRCKRNPLAEFDIQESCQRGKDSNRNVGIWQTLRTILTNENPKRHGLDEDKPHCQRKIQRYQ